MKTLQKIFLTLIAILKWFLRLACKTISFIAKEIADGFAFMAKKLEASKPTKISKSNQSSTSKN